MIVWIATANFLSYVYKYQCEYISIEENVVVEAGPIVAVPFTTPVAYQKYFISLWNHH